jgi:hypothetical protein
MSSIIFDGDKSEKLWCDPPCDALLIERRDGSHICSICCREYRPDSVNKHKRKLGPTEDKYDSSGPEIIPLTGYGSYTRKKTSVFDREDSYMASKKSGFNWVEHEDYTPTPEQGPKPKQIGRA